MHFKQSNRNKKKVRVFAFRNAIMLELFNNLFIYEK